MPHQRLRDILSIVIVCLVLAWALCGCESGTYSSLTYEHREGAVWTRSTVLIPSTITASNLVITWKPLAGEVDYKADFVTRSNEGIVKLTSDRNVRILDSTGKLVGVIAEGVVKGFVEGAKIP